MTYFFDYTLGASTLNNATTPYTWVLDNHNPLNNNNKAASFVTISNGVFTITSPGSSLTATASVCFVAEKQNTGDADDNVLATIADTFSTSANGYGWGTAYVNASSLPFTVSADYAFFLLSPITTTTFAPILVSGPNNLGYNILAFSSSLMPYTKLRITLSYTY